MSKISDNKPVFFKLFTAIKQDLITTGTEMFVVGILLQ